MKVCVTSVPPLPDKLKNTVLLPGLQGTIELVVSGTLCSNNRHGTGNYIRCKVWIALVGIVCCITFRFGFCACHWDRMFDRHLCTVLV